MHAANDEWLNGMEIPVIAEIVLSFVFQPKIAEENLTYAELELVKPHQAAKGTSTSTVYAQILFEENKL